MFSLLKSFKKTDIKQFKYKKIAVHMKTKLNKDSYLNIISVNSKLERNGGYGIQTEGGCPSIVNKYCAPITLLKTSKTG
jgi:hypothetical protein